MDGRSATGAAIAVCLIGIVAFVILDGAAAGLALLVAGVLLVVIGAVGWQEGQVAAATSGGPTSLVREEAQPMLAEAVPDPSGEDRPAEAPWPHLRDEADETRDATGAIPLEEIDDPDHAPEPVSEEAPAPQRQVAEVEAVADPLGRGRTDSVLDVDRDDGDAFEGDRPEPEPTMQAVYDDASGLDHVHDEPLLGHSDLVAHVRDYHAGIPTDGSTIQLRLLHERAHGAPHELPVNLKTS
jgi:hypothetical protein